MIEIVSKLSGLLFGDKGYISQNLLQKLLNNGLKLITNIKKNMKNTLWVFMKRTFYIKDLETVFDILKNKLV